jgi:hypothetical protein
MWSAIAAIVAALGSGIRLATEWFARKRDQLLLSLGRSQQQSENLQERIDAIEGGIKARESARADVERGDILSDDGFRRKDDD